MYKNYIKMFVNPYRKYVCKMSKLHLNYKNYINLYYLENIF